MKRFLSLLLSLVMCFTFAVSAFAVEGDGNTYPANTPPSDEEVQSYALNFMVNSQENDNIKLKDFIHLYDNDENLTGYYVTFDNEGTAAGYILLSIISGEDPVVEFSFEGSGPLMDTEVTNDTETVSAINDAVAADTVANTNTDVKIIYTGPDSMYVPVQGDEYYSVYDHDTVTLTDDEICAVNATIQGGIIDWSASNVDSSSVYKIKSFGKGTDYWIMTNFSNGKVCAPVAATNILWYWGTKRGCSNVMNKVSSASSNYNKAKIIYNTLFKGMKTSEAEGTDRSNILLGYQYFFGAPDITVWNYKEIKFGSAFSAYQAALNDNCPVHISLVAGEGHSVFGIGHAKSKTGAQYLFVMDGWNNYGRFVKFSYYGKDNIRGIKIWVA